MQAVRLLEVNLVGYDIYLVRKCSCSGPIVYAVPGGAVFGNIFPDLIPYVIRKTNLMEAAKIASVFLVKPEHARKNFK